MREKIRVRWKASYNVALMRASLRDQLCRYCSDSERWRHLSRISYLCNPSDVCAISSACRVSSLVLHCNCRPCTVATVTSIDICWENDGLCSRLRWLFGRSLVTAGQCRAEYSFLWLWRIERSFCKYRHLVYTHFCIEIPRNLKWGLSNCKFENADTHTHTHS